MSRTLIYINDQLCDVLPNTVVSVTYQAFEIGDLTRRNINFTNRFQLPKTARNKQILGFSDNTVSLSDAPYTRLSGKIVQDGMEILSQANVRVVEISDRFNIEFFSDEISLFDIIRDKNINTLFMSTHPESYDWGLNDSVVERVFFNDGTLNESTSPLSFAGRWAVPYKTIIERIIHEAGYSVSGDVFNSPLLEGLSLLLPHVNGEYNDAWRAPRECKAHRDTSVVFNATSSYQDIAFTEVEYNGGFYDGVSRYVVDDPVLGGTYFLANAYAVIVIDSISFGGGANSLEIQLSSGSGTYTIGTIAQPVSGPGVYLLELSDFITQDPTGSPVTSVAGIDNQQIYVRARACDAIFGPTGTATVTFGEGTHIRVEGLKTDPKIIAYLSTQGAMPDVPQIDFMRDFAVRFCVLFRVKGSVVECKTIKEILKDTANAIDWTGKRDMSYSDHITFQFRNYGQSNVIRYRNGDDLIDEFAGQGVFEINNINLKEEQLLFSSPFANSYTRPNGNSEGFITCAVIPIDDGAGSESDPGPRLLMVRDKRSVEPTLANGNDNYRVAYFLDVDGLEGKDASYQVAIDEYYKEFSQSLHRMKTVTRYYMLTPLDVAKVDLFQLVYDSGSYYMIEKIENYVAGRPTKVTLLQIIGADIPEP